MSALKKLGKNRIQNFSSIPATGRAIVWYAEVAQQLPGLFSAPAKWVRLPASPVAYAGSTTDTSVVTLDNNGSELILIPAGESEMGDGEDANCPRRRGFLDAYYIGKFAVTNAQYAFFAKATG